MDKYDEYKFFAQLTQQASERRRTATQVYLGVNAAMFTVFAFLVKDGGLREFSLVIVSLPLFLAGVLVCCIWHKAIKQYMNLIGWRYDQLMALEPHIPECHQFFIKEWEEFYKARDGKERFGFARLELWLPRLFIILYGAYGVGLVLSHMTGWLGS